MITTYKKTIFVLLGLLITACGGSGGDDGPTPPIGGGDDDPVIPDPGAATLVFPADNSECNTGVVNPNDNTRSTVTFEWNASANTTSYTINVTNLDNGTTQSANSNTNSAAVLIARGTPFSWQVISRATGTTTTATSSTFRFYNEGPGIENYAPFPASVESPARGANLSGVTEVTLSWSGSDVDNDISSYEVYFGTDESDLPLLSATSETEITGTAVSAGNTYYWYVVTIDSANNKSTSEVFEFRVN